MQPVPIGAAITPVIDRTAIPGPTVKDRLVPNLVIAIIVRIAPRRRVIVAIIRACAVIGTARAAAISAIIAAAIIGSVTGTAGQQRNG
jgi:hypothetical protein